MRKSAIPSTVWALGFVSLLMDMSSEMIHCILPAYLAGTLGLSVLTIGIIEGLAEATALIVKVFSGIVSDYIGRRKALLVLGYGLAAVTKPIFPLAQSAEMVFSARIIDRIGKGLRGAPRDALVADVTSPEIRGASFGLRQSMDTVGAFLGPIIAFLLLFLYNNDIQLVLWVAIIPAFCSVGVLIFAIQEKKQVKQKGKSPINFKAMASLSKDYWWIVVIGGVFTLARFSEAFLVLMAGEFGLTIMYVPLAMVVMSLVYSLSAYPAGILADNFPKSVLLALALVFLVLADLILALASSAWLFFLALAFWGLHLGFSQGILAALVAEYSPKELKGTAFGLFNLVSGLAMLLASVIAGLLWESLGSAYTFYAGGFFALATMLLLFYWQRKAKTIS